jgi:DNA-binding NarL/FixJ family response regulator
VDVVEGVERHRQRLREESVVVDEDHSDRSVGHDWYIRTCTQSILRVSIGLMSSTVTVIAADDEPLVREALLALLEDDPRLDVVGVGTTGTEAVGLATAHQPTIALLDMRMPHGGVGAIRAVRAASPRTRVVVLSAYDDTLSVMGVLRAGAVGFLTKGRLTTDLPGVLVRCAAGEVVIASEAAAMALDELIVDRV